MPTSPTTRVIHEAVSADAHLVVKTLAARMQAEAAAHGLADKPLQADALDLIITHAPIDTLLTAWRDRQLTREGASVG